MHKYLKKFRIEKQRLDFGEIWKNVRERSEKVRKISQLKPRFLN
jgi:hypothetical protein